MYLIRPPRIKAGFQQQKLQKVHKLKNIMESLLGQGRNKEVKDFQEINGNDCTAHPKLQNTMKVVLRGKFIALSAFIKKFKSSYSNFTAYLKLLEQQNKSKHTQEK